MSLFFPIVRYFVRICSLIFNVSKKRFESLSSMFQDYSFAFVFTEFFMAHENSLEYFFLILHVSERQSTEGFFTLQDIPSRLSRRQIFLRDILSANIFLIFHVCGKQSTFIFQCFPSTFVPKELPTKYFPREYILSFKVRYFRKAIDWKLHVLTIVISNKIASTFLTFNLSKP